MSRYSNVFNCNVFELPKIANRAGNITPIHNNKEVPFEVRRVYYLYDVPGGATRGGHAHINLQQFVIAASGSFDVILSDGYNQKTITLNRPNYALYIPPGIWRDLYNFSSGAVLLVLASEYYSENDYIRDYNDFLSYKKNEL